MEQIRAAIGQMIQTSDKEMAELLSRCHRRDFKRKAWLSEEGRVSNEVFFINKGMVRVLLVDVTGTEHTVHFASENQFIAEYSSFLQHRPSVYQLQALEPVEVVVMPRAAVEWGYQNLDQGDRLGRLIAEYYFLYLDHRIQNLYANDPATRYATIETIFPNIHNRAPQHMIASYLGITPVHLSRLKKASIPKQ
jgi:CRP-like cAMP-binding protein